MHLQDEIKVFFGTIGSKLGNSEAHKLKQDMVFPTKCKKKEHKWPS